MSLRQKDYKVGYKRPPQHTQLKYHEFVANQGGPGGIVIEYVGNDETRRLAEGPQERGTKNE
jgi:hypothetical protein